VSSRKTKTGQKQCLPSGIVLGPWRWPLFWFFNRRHLGLNSISVSAQYCTIIRQAGSDATGEVWQTRFLALPILSFPLCCANAISAAILTLHVGETWQKK
jgi:hypothetical protein